MLKNEKENGVYNGAGALHKLDNRFCRNERRHIADRNTGIGELH